MDRTKNFQGGNCSTTVKQQLCFKTEKKFTQLLFLVLIKKTLRITLDRTKSFQVVVLLVGYGGCLVSQLGIGLIRVFRPIALDIVVQAVPVMYPRLSQRVHAVEGHVILTYIQIR